MSDLIVPLEEFATSPEVAEYFTERFKAIYHLNDDEKYTVSIDCPYAQYVEFGSDPAEKTTVPHVEDPICKDKVTEVNLKIRDWAQDKFGLDDKMRKKRGDAIYKQIMEEGMKPSPFIRPALFFVLEDMKAHMSENPEDSIYFKPGVNTTEVIANEVAAHMAKNLMQNDSIVNGDLMRGINVVLEKDVIDEIPDDLREIRPEIWEDMHLDRHGNRIEPKNR